MMNIVKEYPQNLKISLFLLFNIIFSDEIISLLYNLYIFETVKNNLISFIKYLVRIYLINNYIFFM